MKLIIHDLKEDNLEERISNATDSVRIISNNGDIHNCIGCFGCWIKTPGVCIIHDEYRDMGEYLSKCSELIIISQCYYGGFSPFIKNVLDRSISYIHPDFVIRNGEMHHKRRYNNQFEMQVYFYGENVTEQEKHTAEKLVKANAVNFDCNVHNITFVTHIEEITECI